MKEKLCVWYETNSGADEQSYTTSGILAVGRGLTKYVWEQGFYALLS